MSGIGDDRRAAAATARTGGGLAIEALVRHGVERVFCVPGESYLPVLDALYDERARIPLISCRHESGAAMMAAATGHLRGTPGVCFVTRGPGATNASIAVHIARQASLPMVLGVGQVARHKLGREAFQEVDYEAFFAPLAKHVEQVEAAADVPAAFARALAIAVSDRAGPVVLALPEDVLSETATVAPSAPASAATKGLAEVEMGRIETALRMAERPLLILGGTYWDDAAVALIRSYAERNALPVVTAFRRMDVFDCASECYAGYLGVSAHEAIWQFADAADCVIVVGARLDEPTTRGYKLFRSGTRTLIHIHPDAEVLGKNYPVSEGLCADVGAAARALSAAGAIVDPPWRGWRDQLRRAYVESCGAPATTHALDLSVVMQVFNVSVGDDAIVTLDAGNFTRWPMRYRGYRRPGRLLGPINGAMGYGVPAAIAASLNDPERTVCGFVGDGGMLMTGMELATAAKYGATPIVLVFNNSKYGTIETHQERHYPGRPLGVDLLNPDFVAFARAFDLFAERVERTEQFEPAFRAALDCGRAAVIELVMPT